MLSLAAALVAAVPSPRVSISDTIAQHSRARRSPSVKQYINSSTCEMLQPDKDDIKIYLINLDISKPRLIRMSEKVRCTHDCMRDNVFLLSFL